MKLYCHICHKFCAEIRDASIRKGTVITCRCMDCEKVDDSVQALRDLMGMGDKP